MSTHDCEQCEQDPCICLIGARRIETELGVLEEESQTQTAELELGVTE